MENRFVVVKDWELGGEGRGLPERVIKRQHSVVIELFCTLTVVGPPGDI